MFGSHLGTGDYGHMTIEHASILFRVFGSVREYSNQSIEAAHSMQRQLYSKATSHDRHGYTSSSMPVDIFTFNCPPMHSFVYIYLSSKYDIFKIVV